MYQATQSQKSRWNMIKGDWKKGLQGKWGRVFRFLTSMIILMLVEGLCWTCLQCFSKESFLESSHFAHGEHQRQPQITEHRKAGRKKQTKKRMKEDRPADVVRFMNVIKPTAVVGMRMGPQAHMFAYFFHHSWYSLERMRRCDLVEDMSHGDMI